MVLTICCLAAGRTRRLMNPLPATSARSSHSECGSAATSSSASSRGLRFSARASCMAAGQEKSPCCACLGRSSEISEPGCCGATLASARVSSSVRWDLISVDMKMSKGRVLYLSISARSAVFATLDLEWSGEGRMSPASTSNLERQFGQRRQAHIPRQDIPWLTRQDPTAQGEETGEEAFLILRGKLKLDRIDVEMPAHAVRR